MYQLYIGNKNYSSWSLRPWVLMKELTLPFVETLEPFESADNFEKFREFSPNGRVPCLIDGESTVWDSLGIVEYLAERHQQVWPQHQSARTFARCASAEMHSSFSDLRNICPMNCAITVEMNELSPGLRRDIARIDELWLEGLSRFGGGFLAGDSFTAVDAFFCPVAFRFRSYGLPLSDEAATYCDRLLRLSSMVDWADAGILESWVEDSHEAEARSAGTVVKDLRKPEQA